MLLGFVFVVMTITIVQEQRTERALDALRDLSSPRALVIRNGEARRIDSREVVRGDIIVVAEGERVPADALVRRATHLCVDEALLTGESVPVRKRAAPDTAELEPPGGEDLASVFSGTLVTAGQAVCEVKRTGADATAARDPARRAHAGRLGARGLRRGDHWLFATAGWVGVQLAGRPTRGHRDGDGYPARGIPGGAHGVPGARRLAHQSLPRPHAPHARH
jgi:magnesium-transporting ATPase (P-type)